MGRRLGRSAAGSSTRYNTVVVRVPLPVTLRVRRVSYAYPTPRQRFRRSIRVPLVVPRERYLMRRVAVRLPAVLPVVPGSYVSTRPGRLTIHSRRQFRRLMEREFNRPRERERKGRRRQGRNGQLESVRSDRLGIVAEAVRRGLSAAGVADAAMVSRALGG